MTVPFTFIAKCPLHGFHGERQTCATCGGPVDQVLMVSDEALAEAVDALKPVLAAYRSTAAHVTQEQITRAWTAYDELRTYSALRGHDA